MLLTRWHGQVRDGPMAKQGGGAEEESGGGGAGAGRNKRAPARVARW